MKDAFCTSFGNKRIPCNSCVICARSVRSKLQTYSQSALQSKLLVLVGGMTVFMCAGLQDCIHENCILCMSCAIEMKLDLIWFDTVIIWYGRISTPYAFVPDASVQGGLRFCTASHGIFHPSPACASVPCCLPPRATNERRLASAGWKTFSVSSHAWCVDAKLPGSLHRLQNQLPSEDPAALQENIFTTLLICGDLALVVQENI